MLSYTLPSLILLLILLHAIKLDYRIFINFWRVQHLITKGQLIGKARQKHLKCNHFVFKVKSIDIRHELHEVSDACAEMQ